jgi:hypothetical protein
MKKEVEAELISVLDMLWDKTYMSLKIRETTWPISESSKDKKGPCPPKNQQCIP